MDVTDRTETGARRGEAVGQNADRIAAAWRTRPAQAIGPAELRAMRTVIAKAALLGDGRHRRAAAGDVASAIGIALDAMRSCRAGAGMDAAMTALALCAVEGNPAACLVMSHVIRRLPDAGRPEARLATSWLVRAFRNQGTSAAAAKLRDGLS